MLREVEAGQWGVRTSDGGARIEAGKEWVSWEVKKFALGHIVVQRFCELERLGRRL